MAIVDISCELLLAVLDMQSFARRSSRVLARTCAVIALVGAVSACAHPGPATAPARRAVQREFPPFPAGDPPPSTAEIAAMIARGVPERDRPRAIQLLVDDILSRDLRDLPGDRAARPSARAIAYAVYDTLTTRLGALAGDQRLARLATIACTRRGDRILRTATAVAVARFVAQRGRPRARLVIGYLDEAGPYLAIAPEQLAAEADRIERDLAAYERAAQADATCAYDQRIAIAHARGALGAARSGQFDTAAGPLYVFLRNAGENPQRADSPGP